MRWILLVALVPTGLLLQAEEPEAMTLPDLQVYARRHAPSLARQRLTYSNLVESVTIAKTKFEPEFQVRHGWEESDNPERTVGSVSQTLPSDLDVTLSARNETREGEEYTRYALNLSKTLLGGGTVLESELPIERAWINEAREANRLSLERRRLRLTVAQRYYAVVRNKLTLRLREMQLDRAKQNLEHAIAKEDPLDIATAELRVPESELDVLTVRRLINSSTLELAQTIGMPVQQPLNVSTQLVYRAHAISPEEDLSVALENHEEILNAKLSLELNRMEAKVARTRNWPELRVEATYEERHTAGDEDSDTRAELVLDWPWLDRADRAETRRRDNDVLRAEVDVFDAEQSVRKDIEETAVRFRESVQAVDLRRERVRVLERQLLLYQDRWDNGEINILEYVRSQNDLENARVQLVTQQARTLELLAEYDFFTAR